MSSDERVQHVDYDVVAPAYDQRYSNRTYDGTRAVLHRFLAEVRPQLVLEVGCGTGHWLAQMTGGAPLLLGMDRSAGMLARARQAAPSARLVRADAVALPCVSESVDAIVCVNVLHHITDRGVFLRECRRVLRSGGGFLTVGSDPRSGTREWWLYDFFPAARAADEVRYPSIDEIRALLIDSGFTAARTEIAEHFISVIPVAEAETRGLLDRRSTSQLMVIGDDEYADGLRRLLAAGKDLRTDLRLFATVARVPHDRA